MENTKSAFDIFFALSKPDGSCIDVSWNDDIQFEVCAYGCTAHIVVMNILLHLGAKPIVYAAQNACIYKYKDEEIMVVFG